MSVTDEHVVTEAIEAQARRLMAKRAHLGTTWETRQEQALLLVLIDIALDDFNASTGCDSSSA